MLQARIMRSSQAKDMQLWPSEALQLSQVKAKRSSQAKTLQLPQA